jgi:hypothetical protein
MASPVEMLLDATPAHPLSASKSVGRSNDVLDVSRPSLRRLTTETERQVAESSRSGSEGGSLRGSLDMLRMSAGEGVGGGEVEVLIHQVRSSGCA